MKIVIESGMTISIPKTKNATDYVKQSVTIELDDSDIAAMLSDPKYWEGLEMTIEDAQDSASNRVFAAITEDLKDLGVT